MRYQIPEILEESFGALERSRKYILSLHQSANRKLMELRGPAAQEQKRIKVETGGLLNSIDALLKDR